MADPKPKDFDTILGEERVRYFMDRCYERAADPEDKEYSIPLAPHLTLHSTTLTPLPRVTFTFTVQPQHLNGLGNMHGGCTATLFDLCTSTALALISRPGFWHYLGVSRSLNLTYLKPIPVGSVVLVECEVVSVGKRMALLRGAIKSKKGEVFATCEHGKFNTDPEPGKL